ncbi:OsmC family peroxiredoxin [Dyadobacter subterraneus]|uniref:OsmC family peroxiredoxin n=1 Tax=Dyadobacter subterraneus TaxID=2773304 RepID=A0ABR9W8W7_9BACT|nr:OsmC family peroxiredoxin [Dyadobacter subterraneus]MBE9461922.1 OsmC family peroxiredoxin [Dyadobacter subterraneus]
MKAIGKSTWEGTWKEGTGTISTKSAILTNAPVSYSSRFEGAPGASPEELLAAAHAACFNQALANIAGQNNLKTESINTEVEVELGFEESTGHPEIKGLHFNVQSSIPNATEEQFQDFAQRASVSCTISKIIKVKGTVTATLIK